MTLALRARRIQEKHNRANRIVVVWPGIEESDDVVIGHVRRCQLVSLRHRHRSWSGLGEPGQRAGRSIRTRMRANEYISSVATGNFGKPMSGRHDPLVIKAASQGI